MTREEAAEIILQSQPFTTCHLCAGRGFDVFSVGIPCTLCIPEAAGTGGTGKVLKHEYRRAYALLGVEPPRAKWTSK